MSACNSPDPDAVRPSKVEGKGFEKPRGKKRGRPPLPSYDLLEAAWGIIANAGGGDWNRETKEWQEAAACWREAYHASLDREKR